MPILQMKKVILREIQDSSKNSQPSSPRAETRLQVCVTPELEVGGVGGEEGGVASQFKKQS